MSNEVYQLKVNDEPIKLGKGPNAEDEFVSFRELQALPIYRLLGIRCAGTPSGQTGSPLTYYFSLSIPGLHSGEAPTSGAEAGNILEAAGFKNKNLPVFSGTCDGKVVYAIRCADGYPVFSVFYQATDDDADGNDAGGLQTVTITSLTFVN